MAKQTVIALPRAVRFSIDCSSLKPSHCVSSSLSLSLSTEQSQRSLVVLVVTRRSSIRGPSPAAVPGPHLFEGSSQRHPQGAALHGLQQAPVTCSLQACDHLKNAVNRLSASFKAAAELLLFRLMHRELMLSSSCLPCCSNIQKAALDSICTSTADFN